MIKGSSWFKKLAPVLAAIAVFLLIDMVYFAPQFKGQKLQMHDITQYEGMGRDIELHIEEYGSDPHWAGRMFSGMPSYLIRFKQPMLILPKVRPAFEFIGYPASLIFVAMLSFYLMLLMWGVNPWVALPSSLGYGLSSYLFIIIGAGHVTKMVALAYAPLLIGTVFLAYRKNRWLGAALASLVGSIEIGAAHPQITYYFVMILVAFVVNEAVRAYKKHIMPEFVKTSAVLLLAGVLAVGANFSSLYYTAISSKDTVRGGSELSEGRNASKGLDLDYATAWSYGLSESFNMLIPNLMGGESSGGFSSNGEVARSLTKYNARSLATQLPGYWGTQPMTSGPVYIGAVMVFLAFFGFFLLTGMHKWWVIIISGIALMLAWGNNFMFLTEMFFKILPGYNKFRTVSMILVILQWSLPFMAAMALNKLLSGGLDRKKVMDSLIKSLSVVGGICLLFLLFGSSMFSFSSGGDAAMGLPDDIIAAMKTERAQLLKSDALRSLFFVVATGGLIYLFMARSVRRGVLIALISLLVTVDLLGVNYRYLPQSKFVDQSKTEIKPSQVDEAIMQDKELGYRVANFAVSTFNDATTSYFHRSVGGYHGAKLSRYQDLIDNQLSRMNIEVYNMLNTKYFISANEDNTLKAELNQGANGAAWFVDSLFVTTSPRMEMDALNQINTKRVAVVDESFVDDILGVRADRNVAREIELVEYFPHHLTYKYKSELAQTVVFSEVYYPNGWSAYIDGEKVDYFRVNYLLRALVVPEGEHVIEFKFEAPRFTLNSWITLISSLVIIISVVIFAVLNFRKKYDESKQQ